MRDSVVNIPLTSNAIKYVIRHLFMVAFPAALQRLTIDVAHDQLSAVVKLDGKIIKFSILPYEYVEKLIGGNLTLQQIPTADNAHAIPILQPEGKPFAAIHDEHLEVYADIILIPFIMLSRYEEFVVSDRDKFNRFESKSSIATKYNFIDFPIADEYAMILQGYLKQLFPNEKFTIPQCKIIPTHDIDEIRRFAGLKKSIRTLLGDLYLYKSFSAAIKSVGQYFQSLNNPAKDPYFLAIQELTDISKKYDLCSIFYFMGARPGAMDCGYNIEDAYLKKLFSYITMHNMKIGFHAGFETAGDITLYQDEKQRVESAIQQPIHEVRQHYLRFDIHSSFDIWEKSGIRCDSTLGYADREGFRCGTCYEYHPFNFQTDAPYNFTERPLIVMDGTLDSYRKLTIEEACSQMIKLHSRCKAVGGNFVILWHNATVKRLAKRFLQVYCRFLKFEKDNLKHYNAQ